MWVFHPEVGFVSVVLDDERPGHLVCRARVRQDVDDLRERFLPQLSPTRSTPDRDYGYRAWCTPSQWANSLAKMGATISFSNFKDEVLRRQGLAREQIFHRVWATLVLMESELADQRGPRRG